MKLIFNKGNKGNAEIKSILAHLDADYKFTHLQTDIEHETIALVKLIGQSTYDAIEGFYQKSVPTEKEVDLIKKAQLAILVFAELAFAPNNDINTSNNGRVIEVGEYQRQPWEWQLNKANSASLRRGYRALDVLINTLDTYGLVVWNNSENYKASRKYFIYTTDQFDDIYDISQSRQLYMRLMKFMDEPEDEEVMAVIGATRFADLKTKIVDNSLTADDKILLKKAQRPVAFRALQSAFKTLPVEMFPSGIVAYREKGEVESQSRAEVLLWFKDQADKNLKKLEDYITSITPVTTIPIEPFSPLKNIEGDKFINL